MGSSPSIMKPDELIEFRKLNTSIENVEVPARPENRIVTDKKGFVIFGISILILIPFVVYTLVNVDFRYMNYDTDSCGNFCGHKNPVVEGVPCSGGDFTSKPVLGAMDECIARNSGPIMIVRQLRLLNNPSDAAFLLKDKSIWRSVLVIFLPTAPFVCGNFIFSGLVLLDTTAFLWVLYFRGTRMPLVPVVAWTIFAVTILIIFIVIFKRIRLVIQLYKEATKVLAAMPLVVLFSIFIAFIQVVVFIAAIVNISYMSNSTTPTKRDENKYTYELSAVAIFTMVFNIIVTLWFMRFLAGIQYMTVAGGVARWYFSKNNDQLNSPVWSSFKVTVRYHLGTIAFGSLLMTLFAVVKIFLKLCCRNSCSKCCTKLCCNYAEVLLKFLSGNSYTLTAIHGQSFLRSARRATKLLLTNIGNIVAVNCVGDFVFGVFIMLICALATVFYFNLFNYRITFEIATIYFFINAIIIYVIFGTFQTIIDALFICFCEDSVMNDGISRPYYRSRGLMEFMESTKKTLGRQHTQQ
ncbi:choline transporter-like protein 1 isoform X2 [Zophobas morio]|uniref:choline transporter-like protein 1 isoform X2 n=1 Tax=Zophobas morio TaxID=2755281 RepID=UPI0030836209